MSHPYAGLPLLLVSGIGRSGTTAVRRCLGSHPRIHSTGSENNIIHDLVGVAHANKTIESRRYAMCVNEARYDALFAGLVYDLLWPEPRGERPAALLAYSALTAGVAGALVTILPGVRIVYVVRNGVEVVASRMRYRSFAGDGFAEHCRRWATAADMAEWARGRDDTFVLRHEHLLSEDTARVVLSEAWSLVGLGVCDEAVAELLRVRHHPTDHEPLEHRAGRWASWTREQQDIFREVCGPAMGRMGYAVPRGQAAA